MANRHLSRSIVLQSLFEWDFNNFNDEAMREIAERNIAEFAPDLKGDDFIFSLLDTIVRKRTLLNEIIEKAAPEWPIDKINMVDRNILRLGLAELLFGNRDEVPPKVAINESIELAKAFGGESSSKFINGVLGAVYKEIGEPGKDQTTKKKHELSEEDISKLPVEKKAGAVVYAYDGDTLYLAFVHDIFGYWTLSKGGVEEGESPEEAAVREIKEEISLDITIKSHLGTNQYVASHPEKGRLVKQVEYYLGESKYVPIALENGSGGLDDARWFTLAEVTDLTIYDDILPLITKSVQILKGQN